MPGARYLTFLCGGVGFRRWATQGAGLLGRVLRVGSTSFGAACFPGTFVTKKHEKINNPRHDQKTGRGEDNK